MQADPQNIAMAMAIAFIVAVETALIIRTILCPAAPVIGLAFSGLAVLAAVIQGRPDHLLLMASDIPLAEKVHSETAAPVIPTVPQGRFM
ncbi:hypothetical protein FACS1894186_2390 [Alphaproteobacteria bacterium]|nr:hypothetical protein FACS1894186_2390 [Alphaproteobacteria bacterium]